MRKLRIKSPWAKRAAAEWFKEHEPWNLEIVTKLSQDFGALDSVGFGYTDKAKQQAFVEHMTAARNVIEPKNLRQPESESEPGVLRQPE